MSYNHVPLVSLYLSRSSNNKALGFSQYDFYAVQLITPKRLSSISRAIKLVVPVDNLVSPKCQYQTKGIFLAWRHNLREYEIGSVLASQGRWKFAYTRGRLFFQNVPQRLRYPGQKQKPYVLLKSLKLLQKSANFQWFSEASFPWLKWQILVHLLLTSPLREVQLRYKSLLNRLFIVSCW